ncbi:methyltransferase domain-containing protein [Rhodopseudomonas sp. B29]|uniref:class I SAM-dependent methyltransferase n=1 Tax=Rhodopseudomonas sp. B29 TaxID=95607 RepID=UPI0003B6236D|nr:methyltransferase domain-containing protein [Rhodopseudomonas sp. B29]
MPPLRRIQEHRHALLAQVRELSEKLAVAQERKDGQEYRDYLDTNAAVLQYREAYYQARGHVAPGAALPTARAWPKPDTPGLSYKQKLTVHLDLAGKGVEIGPLNLPLLSKEESNVLYVDHLDTDGLREKYPTLTDIAPIDLPMVNNSLADTLRPVAPVDYVVGSQVMEHVPNPIGWLQDLATVIKPGGMLALSLPDRRLTFDLFREESRPSDMVEAHLLGAVIPSVQAVYDNQSLATAINMHWAIPGSLYPHDVVAGRGAVSPPKAATNHLELTQVALSGKYLDAHCWVFTPASFLVLMAQLASDGFLPYRCAQFYPTNPVSYDRGSSSFTVVLENVGDRISNADKRLSFLMALGD